MSEDFYDTFDEALGYDIDILDGDLIEVDSMSGAIRIRMDEILPAIQEPYGAVPKLNGHPDSSRDTTGSSPSPIGSRSRRGRCKVSHIGWRIATIFLSASCPTAMSGIARGLFKE